MKKIKHGNFYFDVCLATLFTISLVTLLTSIFQYAISLPLVILFSLLASTLWTAIYAKTRVAMSAAAFMVVLVLFLLFEFWQGRLLSPTGFLSQYFSWLTRAMVSAVAAPPGYLEISIALLCLLLSTVSTAYAYLRVHPVYPLLTGGVLLTLVEGIKGGVTPPTIALLLFALSLFLLRHIHEKPNASGARVQKSPAFVLSVLPLCLLALVLSFLPAQNPNEKPNALFQGIGDLAARLEDFLSPWNGSGYDDFGIAGLIGGGREPGGGNLGGPRRANDSVYLEVRGENPGYLKGRVYDTYNGRRWSEGPLSKQKGPLTALFYPAREDSPAAPVPPYLPAFPTEPTAALLSRIEPLVGLVVAAGPAYNELNLLPTTWDLRIAAMERTYWTEPWEQARITLRGQEMPLADALTTNRYEITYTGLRSRTLFATAETCVVDIYERPDAAPPVVSIDNSGDLTLSNMEGRAFTYAVQEQKLSLRNAEKAELLRKSYRGFVQDASVASGVGRVFTDGDSTITITANPYFTNLQAESDLAYTFSTDLPASLPDRVVALAREITAEAPTDYDRAHAIETYLRKNYVYELDMPPLPTDADFVDDFLFNQGKGYCTYFASAMVVMARAIGLPARFVEGFVPERDETKPGLYLASGDTAHAWPEVFLEGFGWIAFEPTASIYEAMYAEENDAPAPTPTGPNTPTPGETPTPLPTTPKPTGNTKGPSFWLLALLVLLAGALGGGAWFFVRKWRADQNRPAPTARDKSIALFSRIGKALARIKLAPRPTETPLEYGRRIDAWGREAVKTGRVNAPWPDARLMDTAALFARLVYDDRTPPTPEELAFLERAAVFWESYARAAGGRPKGRPRRQKGKK